MKDDVDVVFEETEESGAETFSKDKIKKLRKELKEAKAKRDEYLALLQRERADFINYKKDEGERSKSTASYAQEKVILDLLPALDSYDMAFANKDAWEKVDKNWRVGVEYIHQQILKALSEYGVSAIETKVGDKFDPNLHEPIENVEAEDEKADGAIAEITQTGYRITDSALRDSKGKTKILRPTRVKVFKIT